MTEWPKHGTRVVERPTQNAVPPVFSRAMDNGNIDATQCVRSSTASAPRHSNGAATLNISYRLATSDRLRARSVRVCRFARTPRTVRQVRPPAIVSLCAADEMVSLVVRHLDDERLRPCDVPLGIQGLHVAVLGEDVVHRSGQPRWVERTNRARVVKDVRT